MSEGDSGNARPQDSATVRKAPASADAPKGQSFNAKTQVTPNTTKVTKTPMGKS
jgi:hypothetical protein